jgi:hypothetical protein
LCSNRAATREDCNPVSFGGWREIPLDPDTVALWRVSSAAVDILEGPSSPFERPGFVEEFVRNRRRLELAGREGAETLDAWRAQTEERIAALLERRPWGLLHVLGLLRRLPNDQFFLGEVEEEGGPSRFDAYQAEVTERAALKYARWDASGVELDAWEPGTFSFVQERPAVDAERVAEIFSLVRLGGVHLAYLESMRRSIARGQTIILWPNGVADSRPGPELRKRIHLYDERAGKFSFLGETAGTFEASYSGDTQESRLLATQADRTTYREDEGGDWFRYERSRRLIQKRDKRFIVARARGLGPAYEYLKLLEEEVAAQYGLSPELIVAALSAFNDALVRFLYPLGLRDIPADTFAGSNTFAERLAYLDKRGYLIVPDELMDGGILGRWAADAYRKAFPDAPPPEDPDRFAHGLKRLAYLDSYRWEELSLEDGKPYVRLPELEDPVPMPVPFVYPAGDYRVVDLSAVGNFLQGIVDCLRLEEAPRQRVSRSLEQRLGDYFDRELDHLRAFEPSKKLLVQDAPGRHSREVAELDVSVRVGSVLVAIDAKAIHVSPSYRRFVHADLRNRWQKFERYVEHADEQAEKLAQQPRGTNYDLPVDGYTHVVTLVCSTVPEFIHTDSPNYFIMDDLPRVATPPELRNYLAEVAEEDLMALPFARRISGGG